MSIVLSRDSASTSRWLLRLATKVKRFKARIIRLSRLPLQLIALAILVAWTTEYARSQNAFLPTLFLCLFRFYCLILQ
jgi:hypothetical protein